MFFNSIRFHRLRVSATDEIMASNLAELRFETELNLRPDESVVNWYAFEEFAEVQYGQAGIRINDPRATPSDR